jgi:hypothetical protein
MESCATPNAKNSATDQTKGLATPVLPVDLEEP